MPDLAIDFVAPPDSDPPPAGRSSHAPWGAGVSWRVHVSSFPDPVAAAEPVAAILGVAPSQARRIVMSAPGFAVEGVSEPEARRIAEALRALRVRVRAEDARAPAKPRRRIQQSSLSSAAKVPNRRSLGDELFTASCAPFLGRGWALIPLAGLLATVSVHLHGSSLFAPHATLLIGAKGALALALMAAAFLVQWRLFDSLARAARSREDNSLHPDAVGGSSMGRFVLRGIVRFGFLAVWAYGVSYTFSELEMPGLAALIMVGALLPYPMALAVQGVRSGWLETFNPIDVARGIVAAPVAYLGVLVAGLVAAALLVPVMGTLGGLGFLALGDTWMAATGPGLFGLLLGVGTMGLAYVHGVLGHLMGALLAREEHAFGFLTD